MRAEVTDLIDDGGTIAGVRATTPDGPLEIRADLVVGADGRHSTVRDRAGLDVRDLGAPIDVLWMRLSKHPDDTTIALGRFDAGQILVTLDRGDYWQCAYVIPKGGFDALRARGLDALRDDIARVAPICATVSASCGMGRHQAADRHRRSAAAMVPAGVAVHRRRRARDVADRRRRHQPCDPGRRRDGEHSRRTAFERAA